MTCPSCVVALAGPGPVDTITSRIGRPGTIAALGATGALIGYVLGKTIGTVAGAAMGAGAAWYLTREGVAGPVSPERLPPSVSVTPSLPGSFSSMASKLSVMSPSSTNVTRFSQGGSQQLQCWSR